MESTIRRANSADYEDLCRLLGAVDRLHQERLPGIFQAAPGPARSREYLDDLLQDAQALVLLAEAEGRAMGCLVAYLRPTPPFPILVPRRTVFVDSLAVDPACRRRGIGRALMEAAESWAADNGADDLELNVYEFNAAAIAFYRALGYETVSRRMGRSRR